MRSRLPPKKDVALALLQGPSVFVHLDPRREGVAVPEHLSSQPQLVLQVGTNLHPPIPDLDIGDEGIACTLSFNRVPFPCVVPWTAVFALVGSDGRSMVWPDDVPSEVAAAARRKSLEVVPGDGGREDDSAEPPAGEEEEPPAARPQLSAVPAPPDPELDETEPPEEDAPEEDAVHEGNRPLPPYLRVIK